MTDDIIEADHLADWGRDPAEPDDAIYRKADDYIDAETGQRPPPVDHRGQPWPSEPQAERDVIGCLFNYAEAYGDLAAIVTADDFYLPSAERAFSAFGSLAAEGKSPDPWMVHERTGVPYDDLLRWQQEAPSLDRSIDRARHVADRARRRAALLALSEAHRDALDTGRPWAGLAAVLEDAPAPPAVADWTEAVRPVAHDNGDKHPAAWTRDDGETLLYAGRLNTIYGLPGDGKSWTALIAAVETMRAGRVAYLDFEDKPSTVAARAQLLGELDVFTDSDRFRYIDGQTLCDGPAGPVRIAAAAQWCSDGFGPGLMVLDAAESAGCPSDGSPVVEWYHRMVDPWLDAGCGVLVVDHVPKRSKERPAGAIGSQHKQARASGAALLATGAPWTKRLGGKLILIVEKDRPGDLPAPKHKPVAVIVGHYDEHGGFRYTVETPDPALISTASQPNDATLNRISGDVLDAIDAAPDGLSKTAIRKAVKGRGATIDAALDQLVDEGELVRGDDNAYRRPDNVIPIR